MSYLENKTELKKNEYAVINSFYSRYEIDQILICIENAKKEGSSFLKTTNLFAIRQFIKSIPELKKYVFNEHLMQLLSTFSKDDCFLTKAIYFDKPGASNWFVGYHQDLSISVQDKVDVKNYTNWTFKKEQYGVQPPIKILQDTITVRIHLDNTNKDNGALKVIPKSHLKGIIRTDSKGCKIENEQICEVKKGGIMLMNPLTMHASNRTTNNKQRRVIHLEFNKHTLTAQLSCLEKLDTMF